MMQPISLKAIGEVINQQGQFQLKLQPEYRKGLASLERFSHIQLLWWGHQVTEFDGGTSLTINQPYVGCDESVGLFSTRSEQRPNPILLSVVSVLSIDLDKGLVIAPWLDANHGSPIIDIKPYQPSMDRVKDVELPTWCSSWPNYYEDSATFDWESVFNFS